MHCLEESLFVEDVLISIFHLLSKNIHLHVNMAMTFEYLFEWTMEKRKVTRQISSENLHGGGPQDLPENVIPTYQQTYIWSQ